MNELRFLGTIEFYSMTLPTIRRPLFMRFEYEVGFDKIDIRMTVPFENFFLEINSPVYERLERY